MPSTTESVLKSSRRSGHPASSKAQSSPEPTTTEGLDGSERVRLAISSNSFIASRRRPDLFLEQVEHREVDRVERGMSADRREQVVGLLVKGGEQQCQQQERQKGDQ